MKKEKGGGGIIPSTPLFLSYSEAVFTSIKWGRLGLLG